MDFRDSPAEAEFRQRLRAWLADNNPGLPTSSTDDEYWTRQAEWHTALYDAGFFGLSWPKKYGGHELPTVFDVIVDDELAAAGAPPRPSLGYLVQGITSHASDAIKDRFLPDLISGRERWCQGFSEPDAGSDLASLKTKAELDGDEWVINGQKIWTTQAQYADYVFLLARTDPNAPKHAGISYLLVPMRQEGIEVRPIVQPDGSAEFNEVFFTDVRAPKENVVGGLNNGWKVAMTTLGFERGSSATTSHRRFEKELDAIIDNARENGRIDDPTIRQSLAKQWSKIQIMRINGYRTLSAAVQSKKDLGVAALGATNKMFWSETHRDTMNLAMDILGPHAQILTANVTDEDEFVPGYGRRRGRADYPVSILQASFFFSRSETIWGGTAEIQRNIVGERVLGLPKEPKPG